MIDKYEVIKMLIEELLEEYDDDKEIKSNKELEKLMSNKKFVLDFLQYKVCLSVDLDESANIKRLYSKKTKN